MFFQKGTKGNVTGYIHTRRKQQKLVMLFFLEYLKCGALDSPVTK